MRKPAARPFLWEAQAIAELLDSWLSPLQVMELKPHEVERVQRAVSVLREKVGAASEHLLNSLSV